MSEWNVTGAPRFVEGVGMVYAVTKGGSRFDVREQEELEALLAGWISVDERLPEQGDWYLVSATTEAPGGGERVSTLAFLCTDTQTGKMLWLSHNDAESGEWCDVTHWMKLPEPSNGQD